MECTMCLNVLGLPVSVCSNMWGTTKLYLMIVSDPMYSCERRAESAGAEDRFRVEAKHHRGGGSAEQRATWSRSECKYGAKLHSVEFSQDNYYK